jgi:toxin ParE1/3/4
MNKNTSISLGNYFDQFVQSRISEGRFKNVSEVIRAGLRLLEEEESKVIALKKAVQDGIDSGIANDFDPKKHLEDLSTIWDYTFEVWSERQADKYYESLISNCQEIADNPLLGKNYDGITQNLLAMKTNRQIIFYRTLNENYAEITRILNERMDLKKRITE